MKSKQVELGVKLNFSPCTVLLPNFFFFLFSPVQQTTSGIGHRVLYRSSFFGLATNTPNDFGSHLNVLTFPPLTNRGCSEKV